jgi:hypothetical protein
MSRAHWVAAALAAFALLLALPGCGKYGKPVRKSRAFAASPVAETSGASLSLLGSARDSAQEKKPGAR